MPPLPDTSPYHYLALYDRDPVDLKDRALLELQARFPELVLREGLIETVLIEALALVVAELVYAINRLPDAVFDVLLRHYGIERELGAPATVEVRFTVADVLGHEIPAGVRVRLELAASGAFLEFLTDESLTIPAGQAVGIVTATATTNTSAGNGTPALTALEVLDPIAYVDAAETATIVTDGADAEDDASLRARAVTRFSRLTASLALPHQFASQALEDPAVGRALALDLYDPGVGPVGGNPGHLTVAAGSTTGAALSAGAKADLEAALEAMAVAHLDVHVIDPTVTAVPVTVTVLRLAGYTDAQVIANVTAALETWLDPATWPWSGTVHRNEIIPLIDGVDGVDRVVTLTAPAADVVLAGVAPLADAGAIAVTVQAPA